MNKLLFGIFALILFGSCSKDSIDPEKIAPDDVKKQLEAYDWIPTVANSDTKDELYHYKPADCEKDNNYSFSFGSNFQKLKLQIGKELCGFDQDTFEQSILDGKSERSFTYDKEKKSIKFADSDQYESYGILVDEDYLVLTYRNNNPVVDYIPMEYHFKGKSKTEKN
ncbi:hypothetical protein [Sphingobacterium sp. HMA12]|uniref:hypothetical protein n=1 Tax=Sphingobacterium sp. HMA12 TaxID=2050894 RepID=UPI000CEA481A|nr:hypothetical protein [Sphingobacterium sp. HMA12]